MSINTEHETIGIIMNAIKSLCERHYSSPEDTAEQQFSYYCEAIRQDLDVTDDIPSYLNDVITNTVRIWLIERDMKQLDISTSVNFLITDLSSISTVHPISISGILDLPSGDYVEHFATMVRRYIHEQQKVIEATHHMVAITHALSIRKELLNQVPIGELFDRIDTVDKPLGDNLRAEWEHFIGDSYTYIV